MRSGALATWELHLAGLQLSVPDKRIDLPSGAPFLIKPTLRFGDRDATTDDVTRFLPTGGVVEGTLSGPGLSATVVTGSLAGGLSLPGLPLEGNYTLSSIRLKKDGKVILESQPSSVVIHCLGEVMVSSVTSTPMTMDEIRQAGIQLEPGNYEGRRFTMALSIGSQAVNLSVPVAIPKYNGFLDPRGGSGFGPLEITGGDLPGNLDISVVAVDMGPAPGMDPFSLTRPSLSHTLQHNFKALLVIPGSIGYLHQFYKTSLVVLNTLPGDSPFQISHLTATLKLPIGADAHAESAPLRTVRREGETEDMTKPILGPDSQGRPGQGLPVLKGGESGMATYFLEALKEGSHAIDFDIRGQFEGGGLEAAVPLVGKAQGKLLVRNPYFNLVLVHPDVVRKGEVYTLEARLTNTSQTIANGVSLSLDKTRMGSVKLVSDASQNVDMLKPGDTASFKFQLRAMRNGEVRSSYLYIQDGTIGFQLSTGLGERNIRLNPDTLILPKTLNELPEELRESMLRILGQAYSVATSKGALPQGVLPINRALVTTQMATLLSEQGLFLKMGIEKTRVWWSLWRLFLRSQDAGFDQLVRTTEAGSQLRAAFLSAWPTWAAPGKNLTENVLQFGQWAENDPGLSLIAVENVKAGLVFRTLDSQGRVLESSLDPAQLPALPGKGMAWGEAAGRHLVQLPLVAPGLRVQLVNTAQENQLIKLATLAPVNQGLSTVNQWAGIQIPPGGAVTLDLGAQRGASASGVYSEHTVDLVPEPFKVLAVHRYDLDVDASAAPYGTQVMVLFNRPNKTVEIPLGEEGFQAAQALVQVEANQFLRKTMGVDEESGKPMASPAALLQTYPRVISLYLEKPVGPYVQRNLTLNASWADANGSALSGDLTWPIVSGYIPGGAMVKGKVRTCKGLGLPAKLTYYYYQAVSDPSETDLATNFTFDQELEETYYAQVTNNVATEPDGSFQLDYVPEPVSYAIGPFLLQGTTAQGSAWAESSVIGNGQVIEMDLVLEGKGTLEGFVVDSQGRGVADARVRAVQEQRSISAIAGTGGGSFSVEAVTDTSGFYRLPDLKTGVFSIRALKGLYGVAGSGEIPSDGSVVTKNLVLKGKTGTIRVQLVGLDGLPEMNRSIALGIPSGLVRDGQAAQNFIYPCFLTPDASGWVQFNEVPCGDVMVLATGLATSQATRWQGYLDSAVTLTITLKRIPAQENARVSFRVLDALGRPVAGAYLADMNGNPQQTCFAVTDEDGRAPARSVPPGTFQFLAYHPLWVNTITSESVTISAGEEREVRAIMPARSALVGRVTYADGRPVKGAYVAIPPVFDKVQKNRLSITNANGEYAIPSVPTSGSYRLAAVGPELRTNVNVQIQGQPEQTLTANLVLPEPGANLVYGTVFQPLEGGTQTPIANVWVQGLLPSISASEYGNHSWGLLFQETTGAQQTGSDGKFSMKGLPQGAYTLHANSDLFPVEVKLAGDFGARIDDSQERNITLVSSFAGELKGVITQRDGQTPAPVGTRVRLLGGSIGELIVNTVEKGRYAFAKVIPAGDYKIRVEDPSTGDITVTSIRMEKEASQVRNLRLWGRGNLTVNVQDSLGKVLSNGDVTFTHGYDTGLLDADDLPERAQKLLPENNGILHFEDLLEGPVTLSLRNPQGFQGLATVTMPLGGGDAEVTIRLQPVGYIRGLLTRADGSRVPAGRVDAYQGSRWLGVSTTRQEGEEGRFLFGVLPTGTISLVGWDPDVRQVGRAEVEIREGQTSEVNLQTQDKGPVVITVTQEGLPVLCAGIHLQYRGGAALDFSTEATSDTQGKASFMLPPGNYDAYATDPVTLAQGQGSFSRVNDQDAMDVSIALTAVRSLWATALPPPGAPAKFSLAGWKLRASDLGRTVVLDANGQGILRDLSVGMHSLELYDTKGYLRGACQAAVTADGGEIQPMAMPLQSRAIGIVTARVIDAFGNPVDGLYVSASNTVHGYGATKTDLIGQARIEGIYAGRVCVSANGAEAYVDLRTEGETVDALLQLPPVASVRGTIRDALGQPAPFVRVEVSGWTTATDGSGAYRIANLPLRAHGIVASTADGNRRVSGSFTLTQQDQDAQVDLNFAPVGFLQGTLTDPLRPGSPLPVSLRVYSGGTSVAISAADGSGKYRIPSLPAGAKLRLEGTLDDGHTVAFNETFTLPNQEGAVQTLDLTLPRFVDVKGWTLDGRRNKIPMTVILRNNQGVEVNRATTTGDLFDPDHPTFYFRYLLAGQTYRLDGCRELTQVVIATLSFTPMGDKALEIVELQQPLPHTVRLALAYPNGVFAPGPGHFVLTPTGLLGGEWQGDLAADGTATLTDLPNGPFRVRVSSIPNQPNLETLFDLTALPGEVQDVRIQALGLGSVHVAVKTASGRQLPGTALSVSGTGSPAWNALAQGDGTWLVSGVWIGRPMTLQASGFGILGEPPTFTLSTHGQDLSVVYPAPDQGALAGLVKDTQGNPVAGAQVTLRNYSGISKLTDAVGGFRFEPLPVGTYDILVTLPGRANRTVGSATIGGDGEIHLQDLNLKSTGTVIVTVLKDDGSAYSGQVVSLRNTSPDSDGQTHTATSDSNGIATFYEVLEGAITVNATLDGHYRTANGTLSNAGTLELLLRTRDVSRLSGRVRRAGAGNVWPAGTVLLVQGFNFGLQSDGTLVPPTPEPLLDFVSHAAATVKLPTGVSLSLGNLILVKNAVTTLDLAAPAFGVVQGTVRDCQNTVVAGAVVQSGSMQTTTDATGAYRLEGFTMGSCYLVASVTSHASRGTASTALIGDGEVQALNITLKGTGIVKVTTLASDGSVLGGQTVGLRTTSAWSDGSRAQAISGANGVATFPEVLEGSISVDATLETMSCTASGTLTVGQTLQLNLKPQPYTTISGRIQRANTALAWPQGTRLRVNWQSFAMATDGNIQVPSNNPHLDYGNGTAQAYVDLPVGGPLSLGLVTLVKNGDTALGLKAPAFGKLQGTVKNPDGTPISGAQLRLDGSAYASSDGSGVYAFTGVVAGSHTVTAQTSTAIATGTANLVEDDGTVTFDLVLQLNTVTLPVYLNAGRGVGGSAIFATNGAVRYLDRVVEPHVSVDGAAAQVPLAANNIARWLEKDRQIAYTTQMGSVEVTVVRTVGQDSYLLRDEIRFKNTDSAFHRVSLDLAHYTNSYSQDSIKGLSSGESTPVLTGPDRDAGFVSAYGGSVMWGDGTEVPSSVTASSYYNYYPGHIIWSDLPLAPGEEKSIALAMGPYTIDGYSQWREAGAHRMLERIQHAAPEWTYASEGVTWSNWAPAQIPGADALPTWDVACKVTLKDALGRVAANPGYIGMNYYPTDTLARKWTDYYNADSPLSALPPDGGTFEFTLPGAYSKIQRTIARTLNTEFVLQEGAPILAEIKDSHGDPVANAYVNFPNSGAVYSDAQGLTGPMLFTPGTFNVSAILPNSDWLVKTTVKVLAQAGADNRVTLNFPATGQVRVRVLDVSGHLYTIGSISAYLRNQSGNSLSTSVTTGILEWQKLLPGTWTLNVRDPRTNGYLSSVQIQVNADAWTEINVQLPGLAQVNVRVLTPSGGPAAQNVYVCGTASDGSSFSGYTNASGVVNFPKVAPGPVTLRAQNPQNGFDTILILAVAPGAQVPATIQLSGSGTLNLTLNTADGRPVQRTLTIRDGNGWYRYVSTDAIGKVTVTPLPTGRTLTLVDDYDYIDVWSPRISEHSFTFTQDGEQQNYTGIKPIGKAIIRVLANAVPQSGVTFTFRIQGQTGYPTNYSGSTGSEGCLTILDVPLNQTVEVTAKQNSVTQMNSFVLTQGEMTVDIPWKDFNGRVAAFLRRPNGQMASDAIQWKWSATPAGASGNNPPSRVNAQWTDLPVGDPVTLEASGELPVPLSGYNGYSVLELTASAQVTPTATMQEVDLSLPTMASARLRFLDAQGQLLTGSLGATPLYARITSAPNVRLVNRFLLLGSFEDALFHDILEVGDYAVKLTSDHWGELGEVNFTVLPTHDGQVLDVPMTLDWVKTPYSVKVVAGDHVTPVPMASVYGNPGNGNQISLGSMPEVPEETSRVEGSFWGPSSRSVTLGARHSVQGYVASRWDVDTTGPTFNLGTICNETLELPLSVIRARITETDGSDLERMAITYLPDDYAVEGYEAITPPQANLDGKRWSLILGEAEGTGMALTLADADSGLGWKGRITAPTLTLRQDEEQALPEHGWLTGVQLQGQDASSTLFMAVSKDAPGLVRPDLPNWLWDSGQGFRTVPWSTDIVIDSNGHAYGFPDWSSTTMVPKVRVPLSSTLWAAYFDIAVSWTVNGPFGMVDLALAAGQSSAPDIPAQWNFVPTPIEVTAPQGQDPNAPVLMARPLYAPLGWRFEHVYSYDSEQGKDAQGIWHPKLPVGIPLRLETQNFGCGIWWYGFLDMTATDPAPPAPVMLPCTELRGWECQPQ